MDMNQMVNCIKARATTPTTSHSEQFSSRYIIIRDLLKKKAAKKVVVWGNQETSENSTLIIAPVTENSLPIKQITYYKSMLLSS